MKGVKLIIVFLPNTKNEEIEFKNDYRHDIKLDRTVKWNSFLLRVFTAFGVNRKKGLMLILIVNAYIMGSYNT